MSLVHITWFTVSACHFPLGNISVFLKGKYCFFSIKPSYSSRAAKCPCLQKKLHKRQRMGGWARITRYYPSVPRPGITFGLLMWAINFPLLCIRLGLFFYFLFFKVLKNQVWWHTLVSPSYSGGRNRRIVSMRPSLAKVTRPYLRKYK
jgi:hypothetical protein